MIHTLQSFNRHMLNLNLNATEQIGSLRARGFYSESAVFADKKSATTTAWL